MKCEVLLFGQLADALGTRTLTLELPDDATTTTALDDLAERHDVIAALRDKIAIAIDERYATPATPLTPDCTIALIPPVSGG